MDENTPYLTREQAAEALGLSTHRVDQLRYKGDLKTVRLGWEVRVTRESVNAEKKRREDGVPVEYDHTSRQTRKDPA